MALPLTNSPLYPTHTLLVLVIAMTTISQTGCHLMAPFGRETKVATPVVFETTPTQSEILAQLSSHADRVRQIQSDVRVSMDGFPTLRGTLAVEKPQRLRLTAGLLGVSELGVDVGSNEDVFWFWTKVAAPGEEPGIYFARHDQYRQSPLQRAIPIEPSWLIDALGLMTFGPEDRVEGPFTRPDGRLELRTFRGSGTELTTRISVIDARYGWVDQQAMYDSTGRLLAYANSIKYEHHPEYNVNLPSRIEITAFGPDQTSIQLSIDANRYRINSIYGDPARLWAMPNPGDVPLINLVDSLRSVGAPEVGTSVAQNPRVFDHRTSSNDYRALQSPLR